MLNVAIFMGSLCVGGTERSAIALASSMNQRGHRFSIDTYVGGPLLNEALKIGLDCRVHNHLRVFENMWSGLRSTYPYHLYVTAVKALEWRRQGIQIVVNTCPITAIFSEVTRPIHGAKVVCWTHYNWRHESQNFHKRLLRRVSVAYRCSDTFVGVSDASLAAFVEDLCLSQPSTKIYNIVDITHASSIAQRDRNLIVWIGRIVPLKQLEHLIWAFLFARRLNPKLHLKVFGTGAPDYLDSLRRLASELDVDQYVCFVGYTNQPFAELASAGAVVLCSQHEALPTVLVEALAAGTPFVSYNSPHGPWEISDRGRAGLIVPQNSIVELAEAMVRLTTQPVLYQELIDHAQCEVLPRFSVNCICTQWEEVLGLLI